MLRVTLSLLGIDAGQITAIDISARLRALILLGTFVQERLVLPLRVTRWQVAMGIT